MPELNREEFGDVKFYHGTTRDFDELSPATRHGQDVRWPGVTKPESAYVTTSEEDAWTWAATAGSSPSSASEGDIRVYEVEPYGDIQPDRNLSGPQFEVEGAHVKRELTGPVNSQLTLFSNRKGERFKKFEDIARNAAGEERRADTRERLAGGYQGAPQDTRLFDPGPTQPVEPPGGLVSRLLNKPPPSERVSRAQTFEAEAKGYGLAEAKRSVSQEEVGMRLRGSIENVPQAPSLDETFRRL